MTPEDQGTMFANELRAVIRRYMDESDVTVFQAVGALETVKMELFEVHGRWNDKQKGKDDE